MRKSLFVAPPSRCFHRFITPSQAKIWVNRAEMQSFWFAIPWCFCCKHAQKHTAAGAMMKIDATQKLGKNTKPNKNVLLFFLFSKTWFRYDLHMFSNSSFLSLLSHSISNPETSWRIPIGEFLLHGSTLPPDHENRIATEDGIADIGWIHRLADDDLPLAW